MGGIYKYEERLLQELRPHNDFAGQLSSGDGRSFIV
jgi:hypothetical protein